MTCRGLGWADPNLRRGRVAVTLDLLETQRFAVCGLRLGRGPQ